MSQPLGPSTIKKYAYVLNRAFGTPSPETIPAAIPPDVLTWPESSKAMLRAALRRVSTDRKVKPDWVDDALPVEYRIKKVTEIPGEEEALAYEEAVNSLPPGKRALALIPLLLGLRASEVCGLERKKVQRAVQTGDLVVLRKGGEEQVLPASHIRPLLEELLAAQPAPPQYRVNDPPKRAPVWKHAGEILSSASPHTQYEMLRRLVHATGYNARIAKLRPHLLRHAFATRMNRDGAPLFTIQAALNHKNISTTQRYVHASKSDVAKFMRPVAARGPNANAQGTGR